MCGGVFLFDVYWWCIYCFYNFVIAWLPCRSRICNFQCNCMCVFHCLLCAWCVWFGMHLFYYFVVIFQYFRHVCAINLWMVFIWCDVCVYWFCYGFCLLLMYVCGCMSIGFILVLHMLCFNFYIACFHCWAENCDFHFFCFLVLLVWFGMLF